MPGPVLEWRQAARDDLLAIVDTFPTTIPGGQVCEIAGPPELGQAALRARERSCTGYLVIYAEDKDVISILRVLHGAQQWPPERD